MTDTFILYGPLIWLGYALLAAWSIYSRYPIAKATAATPKQQQIEHGMLGFLLLAHLPLAFLPIAGLHPHFGAREAMGLLTWLSVLIYWTAAFLIRLEGLQTILLPVAALTLGSSLLMPPGHATPWLSAPLAQMHFAIAMLAYGFFAVAAGLAVLMRLVDRDLHHPKRSLLRQLPPLLALERLLFGVLGLGFALLSATLLTGSFFAEALFGKPLDFSHNSHKIVFSVAAWMVFGILLLQRRRRGLRGRKAANWTLAGFGLLFLAYIGSRFVLDVLLHRG